MKMKWPINTFTIAMIGVQLLFSTSVLNAAEKKAPAAKIDNSCLQSKKNEFKTLYLKLQQSLNYEGRDVEITNEKTGAFKLIPHKGEEYEGKVFEKKLFKEYQNSLRKVGLLYQAAKDDSASNPADFNSNKELVDFIKAIDNGADSNYIKGKNIETVISELRKASKAKYPGDAKKVINDNDEYLLKKLLTHAQDRICSIREYIDNNAKNKEGAPKKGTRLFSAEEMEKKKNAPLNQLLLAVKDAKLNKDSEINIVDTDVAINSAIQANINALTKWMSDNKSCKVAISSVAFMNSIQPGIQSCNYKEFVNSLVITPDKTTTDIERILHFINSNEKFLKKAAPKAETDLDEFKLQAYVDRTFANNGTKIHCTEVLSSNKDSKRLFVRNLPYLDDKNKFDTSKIACKVKVAATKKAPASERVLTEQECTAKIELISDDLGRGIEVKQKNPKEAPIAFSIKENPECTDLALATTQEEVSPKPETPPAVTLTPESCKELGKAKTPPMSMILTTVTPIACVPEYDDAKCKDQGSKATPPVELFAKKDASGCEPKAKPKKTKDECLKEKKELSPDEYSCVDKKKYTKEECEKEGKDLAEDELSCVDKKESDAEKECREKNEKLNEDPLSTPTFPWIIKDGKCIDSKAQKSKPIKEENSDDEDTKIRAEKPYTPPGRFTPIQIPTRQMYVLPGMP